MALDVRSMLAIAGPTLAILLSAANSLAHAAVEISSKPTKNMSCSGGVCSPTAKKAILNIADLTGMLAGGDVTVKSNSIAQDIEVDAALSWASTHRLTLDSFHDIDFAKPVTVAGAGALTITTSDGGGGGDFRFFGKGHVEFWDERSSLIINGHNYELVKALKDFQRDLKHSDGSGHYYAQAKHWNLSGKTFTASPIDKYFSGTFEGLGNSISNITVRDSVAMHHVGLFDGLDLSATVRDVDLESVDIAGTAGAAQYIGALAGGSVARQVQAVNVTGQVSARGSGSYVGGLIGASGGTVIGCISGAIVLGGKGVASGGLFGYSAAEVTAPAIVLKSYFSGNVSSAGTVAGGAIGKSSGGTISDVYSTGTVTSAGSAPAGGLIGIRALADDGSIAVVSNTYSTGAVSGGAGAPVGGSIGEDDAAGSGIGNDYWDLDTSGVSDPSQGAGNVKNDPGITGLTDAQLKSGLPPGFDPKVWAIDPKINNGYPYLINNPPR